MSACSQCNYHICSCNPEEPSIVSPIEESAIECQAETIKAEYSHLTPDEAYIKVATSQVTHVPVPLVKRQAEVTVDPLKFLARRYPKTPLLVLQNILDITDIQQLNTILTEVEHTEREHTIYTGR